MGEANTKHFQLFSVILLELVLMVWYSGTIEWVYCVIKQIIRWYANSIISFVLVNQDSQCEKNSFVREEKFNQVILKT